MKHRYTYGVMSKDGHWVSALRPTPENAVDNFIWSRQKRGEKTDWARLQEEDGYRLVEFYLTPVNRVENGEWVEIEQAVECGEGAP